MTDRKKQIEEEGCDRHGKFNPACEECFAPPRDANPPPPFRELTREESAAAGKAAASFFDKPSGDDERDAKAYWTQEHISDSGEIFDAFLAGRKGMVPASEVERLKLAAEHWKIRALNLEGSLHPVQIEIAVKAERERCANIAFQVKRKLNADTEAWNIANAIDHLISNPPKD